MLVGDLGGRAVVHSPPALGETGAVLVRAGPWALSANSLVAASSNVFPQLLVDRAAGNELPS